MTFAVYVLTRRHAFEIWIACLASPYFFQNEYYKSKKAPAFLSVVFVRMLDEKCSNNGIDVLFVSASGRRVSLIVMAISI